MGMDQPHSGPVYRSMAVEEGKIRLRFDHANGGLKAKGDMLKGFAIAGQDSKFVWAEAKIDGDDVLVWSNDVQSSPLLSDTHGQIIQFAICTMAQICQRRLFAQMTGPVSPLIGGKPHFYRR